MCIDIFLIPVLHFDVHYIDLVNQFMHKKKNWVLEV